MTTLSLQRDALMPRQPAGMGAGLALALVAHTLLVLALAFGVNWRSSPPDAVEAELWAAVPQLAAPPAPPPAPEPKAVEVKPPPAPKPEPARVPQPEAQIAIEKAKREEAKREEARREELKREEAKREERKREEAERKKKELAEKKKAKEEEERLEAQRQANLKRMLGQAGAAADGAPGGTATQSAGPSGSYAGRVRARIKPNIVRPPSIEGDPVATVEVRLASDGTIVARKLVKSSGVNAWDEAVLRAIDKTEKLPQDIDGRAPPVLLVDFKPLD